MTLPSIPCLARAALDPRTFRAGLQALRPASLVIAAFSCFLGVALAWRDGRGDTAASIVVLAAGIALQAGVNLVNDFFEFKQRKVDDKIARLAVFGAEREALEWVIFLSGLACFAAVVPAGLFLAWRAGWGLVALGAVGFAGGYFYTGEPFNYKRRGLGVVFVFFLMGVLMVEGSYVAVAGQLSAAAAWISLPVGLLVSLILLTNELRDHEADARHGIRTLCVRVGYRAAAGLYLSLLALAYAGPWVLRAAGLFPRPWLPMAALPAAIPCTVIVVRRLERPRSLIPLVMLHHLVYGALYCAAWLLPSP